jgi:hypothetical protein
MGMALLLEGLDEYAETNIDGRDVQDEEWASNSCEGSDAARQ